MSSDGTRIAIGAPYNDGVNGSDSGHVRVYQYDATKTTAVTDQNISTFGPIGWNRVGGDIDGEIYNDLSGRSVAMNGDGTRIAIGAHYNGGFSGHVRVYQYDDTKIQAVTDQNSSTFGPIGWNRVGGDIDGEAAQDESGFSVAMSSDGTRIAIGARYNDGNGSYNGDNRGHVRVYEYDATKTTAVTDQTSSTFGPIGWNRVFVDIDGELNGDQSGYSVAMNSSGTRIAIGATRNDGTDGTDTKRGHVRVYEFYEPPVEPEPEAE
jgi:hypothetical protein